MKGWVVASAHLVIILVVVALVVMVMTGGFSWRDRIPVVDASITDQELLLVVDTCGGDPEIDLLEERDDVVNVAVISTRRFGGPGGMDCLDDVKVRLQDPLDDRPLVDVTTGDEVPVEGRVTEP